MNLNPMRKIRDVSLLEKEVNHFTVTIAASQNKGSVVCSVLFKMLSLVVYT